MSSAAEPESSDSTMGESANETKDEQSIKSRPKSAIRLKQVTIGTRLEIIEKLEKGASVKELMVEYGLHQKTIQRYQRNVKSLREISKCPDNLTMMRMRRDAFEDIAIRLHEWVLDQRKKGKVCITDSMLQKKAKEFHESKFGNALASKFVASGGGKGWLYRFKQKYNVYPNYVHETIIKDSELSTKQLSELISELNMDVENIYIMHKTCLLWKNFPKRINPNIKLAVRNTKRDYIALAFCANIVGTHKLPLLFVHKYAVPLSLKDYKDRLPLIYKHQLYKAIDKNVFNDWYANHFQPSVRQYQQENRCTGKVLLLINNFKTDISDFVKMFDSSDFKLIVLPPNTTSAILPISSKCKSLFWHKLLRRVDECSGGVDQLRYTIKDCIFLISEAWDEVTRADFKVSWQQLLGKQKDTEDTESRPNFETVFVQGEPEVEENVDSEQIDSFSSCDGTLKVEEHDLDTTVQNMEWTAKLEEKEVNHMFHNLEIWAETQSDFIKSCAKVLISHYKER